MAAISAWTCRSISCPDRLGAVMPWPRPIHMVAIPMVPPCSSITFSKLPQIRAPEQHARYVERHGALLRRAMHLTQAQCEREGVAITIKTLLAQCIFVCNALTSVGGVTPYQAVLGRQPAILPPLADTDAPETAGDSLDGRREARIREIAVQTITNTREALSLFCKSANHTDSHRAPIG